MAASVTLHPSAKVNLYLAILGRRPDGYHTLDTLYERLDLADDLRLTRAESGVALRCADPSIPTDDRNLVVQAAQRFFQATGIDGGVDAALTKRIPAAGGLGGGSSDAAAALQGLNALYGMPLDQARLMALGAQLGADVPFFVSDAVVGWGRERGDVITPLAPPVKPFWHVLVHPGVPVPTPAVYAQFDRLATEGSPHQGIRAALTPPRADATLLARLVQAGDPAALAGHLANALEPAIEASYPAVRHWKAVLSEAGALGVLVSGSGSTTYGLARDEAHAREVAARVRQRQPDWMVLTARTALPPPTTPAVEARGS